METERLELKSGLYEQSISRAAELLKSGKTVAIPTETVYGLAASAYDINAVEDVFKAKGRPQDNPLIVHIANEDMLSEVTENLSDTAKRCAEEFWPGPFTMVLQRGSKIPKEVSAGLDTVAVRMPSDKVALDIIKASNLPLAAPSANTSGKPSPTSPEHVLADLDGKISACVMGNDCGVGLESTVVSLCTDPPRLLRPGGITAEQLKKVLPNLVIDKAVLSEPEKGEKVASPGMKYKHYAPNTETFLVSADSDKFAEFVNNKANALAVCFDEDMPKITVEKLSYGTSADEKTLAHNIFSVLRKADGLGVDAVYVHAPSKNGIGLAVYNRLIRAAAFKEISL